MKLKTLTLALALLLTTLTSTMTPAPAHARDAFEMAGLTGGANVVGIAEVKTDGEIRFNTKNPTMSGVRVIKAPEVVFAARCKRSGYRCEKLEGHTTKNFDTDNSEETGNIQASLLAQDSRWTHSKANKDQQKKRAKAEAELISTLKAACAAGQKEVDLYISVRLTCKQVKAAIGKNRYYPISNETSSKRATYKLTCS